MLKTGRLDRYWADELGCTPEALYSGEITVCAPPHRAKPRWMGWQVPLECITVEGAIPGSGVISIAPEIAADLRRYLARPGMCDDALPPDGRALFRFAQSFIPTGVAKVHHILQCDYASFTPAPDVYPVAMLQPDDLHSTWFAQHFDGPVFAARNGYGSIASWAALKLKSPEVWEMAVVTEAAYRGRGLARSVVSHATAYTLDAGKVPIYLHDINNIASAKVCRVLGYRFYGYELTCECGRLNSGGGFWE